MTKQIDNKAVEEMAKVISKTPKCKKLTVSECIKSKCEYPHYDGVTCQAEHYAEALYNAGYRKVDEKFIVVEKSFLDANCLVNKEFVDDIRKEIAREILQEVSTIIKAIGKDYDLSGNQTLSMLCANIYNKVFDKLAEKLGVEVK